MANNQADYQHGKKEEKRSQAVRQVERAYAQCKQYQLEGGDSIFGLVVGGEFLEWRIRMQPSIEELYSTLDIVKALKMPRERLRDWMVRGYIKPSLPATGQGTIAVFTKADIYAVALFEKLIERGLKREVAAGYIESFAGHKSVEQVNQVVFSSADSEGERQIQAIFVAGKSRLKIDFAENGVLKCGVSGLRPIQMDQWDDVHILNVKNLRRKVDAAVKEMG